MPSPPKLTHFLCLPLSSGRAQLQKSLATFKESATSLRTQEIPNGIPEKAIRPLGTLHLTIGVMSLVTQERVESALKLLKELDLSRILSDSKPAIAHREGGDGTKNEESKAQAISSASEGISVSLRGLLSFQEPAKTSVLYSVPVDSDLRLFSFSQKLRDIFTDAKLMVLDSRPLLLHATIVNTIYVSGQRGKGPGHGKNRAKLTMDSSDLLMDYEDFEFMTDVKLEKVAICRMGAKKNDIGEEEYFIEGEVNLP